VVLFFVLFLRVKSNRCGRCGKLRSVQFSKSLVGAFFASTGTAASTSSSMPRKCRSLREVKESQLTMDVVEQGDTGVAAPLEKIAPVAS
jgi:hypothetical protein